MATRLPGDKVTIMVEQPELPKRGFMFWTLAPFLLLFIVLMPVLVDKRDAVALVTLGIIEILAALVLLGLYDSFRFWWAWRGAGALVFFVYLAYFISMLIESGGKIAFTPRKSEASAFNAACGFVAFGLPGLWYAVFGRLSLRRATPGSDDTDVEDEDI